MSLPEAYLSVRSPTALPRAKTLMMSALKFRYRLIEDARWWGNFGLVILTVLLIAGLLVFGRHTWVPDQVQLHG